MKSNLPLLLLFFTCVIAVSSCKKDEDTKKSGIPYYYLDTGFELSQHGDSDWVFTDQSTSAFIFSSHTVVPGSSPSGGSYILNLNGDFSHDRFITNLSGNHSLKLVLYTRLIKNPYSSYIYLSQIRNGTEIASAQIVLSTLNQWVSSQTALDVNLLPTDSIRIRLKGTESFFNVTEMDIDAVKLYELL